MGVKAMKATIAVAKSTNLDMRRVRRVEVGTFRRPPRCQGAPPHATCHFCCSHRPYSGVEEQQQPEGTGTLDQGPDPTVAAARWASWWAVPDLAGHQGRARQQVAKDSHHRECGLGPFAQD